MQNIAVNMCEKCHDDRSRNDGALADRKSDNNKKPTKKNSNVLSAWGPVYGPKNEFVKRHRVHTEALGALF